MRHNARRPKNNKNSKKSARSHVYDSNGPDVRIRGTAHQVLEKYLALAKDARGTGDLIMAENYMQHAEHYQRIINSFNDSSSERGSSNNQQNKQSSDNIGNSIDNDDDEDLGLPASMLKKAEVKEDALEDA